MPDGQGYQLAAGEYYGANGQMGQVRPGMQTPGGQQGTHALQDYQMQLMLLEQQNKRRLMMARQEQDSMSRADGQPPMPGQQLPPGTSPQGSRAGTSPNPNDQMKRGTPKMPQAGLPGSPSAGDVMAQGRASPASMSFNGAQLGPEMAGQFFANGMRPPSSNPAFNGPMGQPGPAGAGNRWQPQQNQGQLMPSQQSPVSQPQPGGTPQERNAMPPPQAPTMAGANTGRTQPSSPQTGSAAPPTPQQANKPGPKSKKEPKDGRKVRIRDIPPSVPVLFFFDCDPSGLQRRRPRLLRMQTQRRLHHPKRSIRRRRLPQHPLRPSIRIRSTRAGQMRRAVLNIQRRLPLLSLLSSNPLTRPNSHLTTLVSQMYVGTVALASGRIPLTGGNRLHSTLISARSNTQISSRTSTLIPSSTPMLILRGSDLTQALVSARQMVLKPAPGKACKRVRRLFSFQTHIPLFV